jgi:hypothetical protein
MVVAKPLAEGARAAGLKYQRCLIVTQECRVSKTKWS